MVMAAEARSLGALAGEVVGDVVGTVRGVHRAIGKRAHAPWMHDAVSELVYACVKGGVVAGGVMSGVAVGMARRDVTASMTDTARGAFTTSAISGLIGDELERRRDPIACATSLRRDGRAHAPGEHPDPTGRVVLFVHGLCETERYWHYVPKDLPPAPTYGARLAELGWSDLYLRYNSGASIAVNGQRLSDLIDEIVDAWPVPVTSFALVGHSMGGLVARAAAVHGTQTGARWLPLLDHVVTLGSPHRGAPIARGIERLIRGCARLPETAPLTAILERRSVGVRDLEPDHDVPPVPGARHTVVAASVGDPDSLWGDLVGDGLVRPASACGSGDGVVVHRLGGLHHFDLLNHPRVWPLVRDALAATS